MRQIALSYVMTTHDKLPLLREVMEQLLANVQPDEEIVVIDGASTDGSKEYLNGLYEQGLIHKFISEKDYGEAHGDNKGFLMAEGELIKLITDDDVFYYPGISECKKYMLQHPEVDLLFTDGLAYDSASLPLFFMGYESSYNKWQKQKTPFSFCGLGLMFRRKSLPLLGLFNTAIIPVDHEFSLRVSSTPAKIVLYTGICYTRILNPKSNSVLFGNKISEERNRLELFYRSRDLKDIWKRLVIIVLNNILGKIKKTPNIFKKLLFKTQTIKDKNTKNFPALCKPNELKDNLDLHYIFTTLAHRMANDIKREDAKFIDAKK
jgi:glycosyltransferase involved in cell wall biosynthesis